MKVSVSTVRCAAALMLSAGTARAHPWKDESGTGQWRESYGWQGDGYEPPRFRRGFHPARSSAACRRVRGAASQASLPSTSRRPSHPEYVVGHLRPTPGARRRLFAYSSAAPGMVAGRSGA
jgi:hypothetical protein